MIRNSQGKASVVALFIAFAILFIVVFTVGIFVGKGLNKEGFKTTRSFEPPPPTVSPTVEEPAETEPSGEAVTEETQETEEADLPDTMPVEEVEVVEEETAAVEDTPLPTPVPVPPDREKRMAEITKELEEKTRPSPAPQKEVSEKPGLPPTDPAGIYTVQIGSFQDQKQANALASAMQSKGYPVFIKSMTTPDKKNWYRVRVGTFKNIETAKTYGDSLKKVEPGVELVFITVNN